MPPEVALDRGAPARKELGSLARGGGLVAPALTLVNLIGYVLAVAAARAFDKSTYGELNALLGVLLVLSVPALALQAVVARSIARRPVDELPGARERLLLKRSAMFGLGVSALLALLSPLLAAFLHTGVTQPLWVAVQLAPFAVLSGAMGVLQGAERFKALALVIVAQALGKGVGIVPLILSGGTNAVLAALAGGMFLTVAVALLIVRTDVQGPAPRDLPGPRDLLLAISGLLALLVLANLDVLLARNVLSGDQSGRYSAGAVLAKAAFWLPQAVAVVVFPRLSEAEAGRKVLRKAVLVVGALGALELLGCLLLAKPALALTFGTSYGSLSGIAPLWVLQGAALSIVQLLVYRAIATGDPVASRVVGVAAVLEALVVLVARPTTPTPVIAVAVVVAVTLAAGLLARSRLTTGSGRGSGPRGLGCRPVARRYRGRGQSTRRVLTTGAISGRRRPRSGRPRR
jgi:O-antigen/teichoic acid export membrane protein